jgi:D-alanyl-D-alanine carboxypeptidase (penicillin-binding protein 5/6)
LLRIRRPLSSALVSSHHLHLSFLRRLIVLALVLTRPAGASAQIRAESIPQEHAPVQAAAWVVADATTGFVLDSSDARRQVQIGSITKIATASVVLDWARARGEDLGQPATVPGTVLTLNSPNSIGLKPGDRISLRDALYAALMQSDNEAAETIAVHVGGKLQGGRTERENADYFVAQMNALARKLGLRNTRFLNAHGLDDLEKKLPYSTAADVALLANYALGQPGFLFYTSQKERRISWTAATGESSGYQLHNTNELLGNAGIDGVKTGTTRRAGACVVVSAARAPESRQVGEQHIITPRRLTVVVLASPSRFESARALLDRGWTLLADWSRAGRPMKGWRPGMALR